MANQIQLKLGFLDATIDAEIRGWTRRRMRELSENAKKLCKKRGISYHIMGSARQGASLIVKQTGGGSIPASKLENWAFDTSVSIPVGGYRRADGRAFMMEKPEGIVFRSRTYSKHSGETIKRKGFLSEAIRQTFTPDALEELGAPLGRIIAYAVANEIKNKAISQGYTAIIVP